MQCRDKSRRLYWGEEWGPPGVDRGRDLGPSPQNYYFCLKWRIFVDSERYFMKLYGGQFALVPLTPDSEVLVPTLPRGLGPWSPLSLSCLVLVPYHTDLWRNPHLVFWTSSLPPPSFATPIVLSPYRTTSSPISADCCKQCLLYSPCVENFERMSHCGEVYVTGIPPHLTGVLGEASLAPPTRSRVDCQPERIWSVLILKYSLWCYHQNVLWRSKNSYRTTILKHALQSTTLAFSHVCNLHYTERL